MNKKDILSAEIQLLAIFVSLILGIGAAIGYVISISGFSENILTLFVLGILIINFISIGFISIRTYIRIIKVLKEYRR